IRIVLQASQPTALPDLRSDAEALIDVLSSNIPPFSKENHQKQAMEEMCPACGLEVHLDSSSEGSCSRSHT
ncbi:hypothetical protein B0H19DRAFT_1113219, partial [Mycena capillaripes]